MKVILSPRAELDIEIQLNWLAAHSPSAGRAASVALLAAFDLLAEFPDSAPRITGDIREKAVRFGRDGFLIKYRRGANRLYVLRVRHGRQNR